MNFISEIKNKLEEKFNKNNILAYWTFMVIFLLFLFPMSILTTKYYNYFIYLLAFCCILVTVFIFPNYIKKKFIIYFIFLSAYIIFSSIVVGANLLYSFFFVLYSLSLISIFYYIYHSNKDIFFLALSDYALAMIVINGLLSMVYQDGLLTTKNAVKADLSVYFLGIGNQLVIYLLAYFTIIFIHYIVSKKEGYRLFLAGGLSLVGVYFSDSATGLTGCLLYIFLCLSYAIFHWVYTDYKLEIKDKKKLALIILSSIVVVHILFTVFNIQVYFETFLESFYNKSVTFSARTSIWREAFNYIKKNPIFGKGIVLVDSQIFMKSLGAKFSAHNIFIEIAMIGGIPGLLIFLVIVYNSLNKAFCINNSKARMMVLNLLLSFFIMSITEIYSLTIITFVLIIPELVEDYILYLDKKKLGEDL